MISFKITLRIGCKLKKQRGEKVKKQKARQNKAKQSKSKKIKAHLYPDIAGDKSIMAAAAYPWLFIVEYYDPLPRLKRQYLLRYWGVEGAQGGNGFVEMVDIKSKKLFLKKSPGMV